MEPFIITAAVLFVLLAIGAALISRARKRRMRTAAEWTPEWPPPPVRRHTERPNSLSWLEGEIGADRTSARPVQGQSAPPPSRLHKKNDDDTDVHHELPLVPFVNPAVSFPYIADNPVQHARPETCGDGRTNDTWHVGHGSTAHNTDDSRGADQSQSFNPAPDNTSTGTTPDPGSTCTDS
jgi:hypothetical protein